MPSFDIVSQIDKHELTNSIDQVNRIITTRFDFKGVEADCKLVDDNIVLTAPADIQLRQMYELLTQTMVKRKLDIKCLESHEVVQTLNKCTQKLELKEGLEQKVSSEIIATVKKSKIKVQISNQDKQLRVVGKKRDDLQAVITLLKDTKFDRPLQNINFRD